MPIGRWFASRGKCILQAVGVTPANSANSSAGAPSSKAAAPGRNTAPTGQVSHDGGSPDAAALNAKLAATVDVKTTDTRRVFVESADSCRM